MCGRFTLATPPEILAALFAVETSDWNDPRFNIAPQVRIVTVRRRHGTRAAQSLLWGTANPRDGKPLINARSETIAASPLFGRAFASARVLIPADGFFEWTKEGARRLGRYFKRPGGGPFAFAGIAVDPKTSSPNDEPAAVILTAQASESVKAYHDRMPLVIQPDSYAAWLDESTNLKEVAALVTRAVDTEWASHPVGPAVNNVRNDTPENIRQAEPAPEKQGRLF